MKDNVKDNEFKLLPKYEDYIVYVNNMIVMFPKACRVSIGDELRRYMYKTIYYIYRLIYVDKRLKT